LSSSRPRILFLTSDVPENGRSGGQIVSWRLLEALAEFGTVDVLVQAPTGERASAELEELAGKLELVPLRHFYYANSRVRTALILVRALLSRKPFRIVKSESKQVRSLIREWQEERQYDLICCDHLSSAAYRALAPTAPAILAEHDVEWQQFAQIASHQANPLVRTVLRMDSRRTRAWEAAALSAFDHVLVLSEGDRARLLADRPDLEAQISVWPIPVSGSPLPAAAGPPTFLVLGSLTPVGRIHGLRWFISNVWDEVRARIPDARLTIVGSKPPADIRDLDGSKGICVHGFVEDLDSVLATTSACVIPLFIGSGVRVKVLELIARAVPCVGTPVGLQGLMPLDGCFEITGPDQWARTLAEIASDPEGSRAQARRGGEQLARQNSHAEARAHVESVLCGLGVLEASPARR
jgi:glycosyltransferase involved in cell wall biosynthesis